jgi:CBS domain containing-hemolysin-like protein
LIFGEIIPKSYAASHAKKFAIFAAPFLHMLQLLLFPFVVIFEWITNIVAGKDMGDTVSEAELRALAKVSTEQGTIESDEGRMIERLFQFNDITAEDIMTPRVHIEYIEDTTTIDEATEIIINHPYTRYPVFHETRDTIIGFVHARDVLLAHHKDQEDDPIKGILHPIMSVPKQMRLDALMEEFQKRQTHMAVVVDEYGGTEGIVTFEDVIEELVGEIADEHDISENLIKRKDKTTVLVSGDTQIRDINDFLNVQIPGNELDTIAEVMLDELQKIPRKGQSVELGNTHCMIIETKKRRIQKVEVKRV